MLKNSVSIQLPDDLEEVSDINSLMEAQRVNKTIKVSAEVIKALIGSTSYGNVGQLKSNIQLACVKGFLNCINTDKPITIDLNLLPPNTRKSASQTMLICVNILFIFKFALPTLYL